jgi:hypothetical protein
MQKNHFDKVEDFVYMPVREYTGVDLDGQIAVPRSEIQQRLKELYRAYESGNIDSVRDPGLRAR